MRRLALGGLVVGLVISFAAHAASLHREYVWEYAGRTWTLEHTFDLATYTRYRALPRVARFTDYGEYVLDPGDDALLEDLVGDLERMATAARFDDWQALHLIASFVQSLRYVAEETEYPRYPIETLVEGCGDCEDLAILTADILRQMGFGVVLLAFTTEMHMAVGIRMTPPDSCTARAFEWNGDAYYYLETTAAGWTIGQVPTAYTSDPDVIALAPATP